MQCKVKQIKTRVGNEMVGKVLTLKWATCRIVHVRKMVSETDFCVVKNLPVPKIRFRALLIACFQNDRYE